MIKYYNASTGKEVKYGEMNHFKKTFNSTMGTFHCSIDLPIINETIPTLIEQGLIVQKDEKENFKKSIMSMIDEELKDFSTEDQLKVCLAGLTILSKQVSDLTKIIKQSNKPKKNEE